MAPAVSPVASGNLVRYRRRGLDEWYRNGPFGLEQGFTLSRRVTGRGSGPLELALALEGSLRARSDGGDIAFLSRSGVVALRYGELSAVDASGRRLRSGLALSGGRLLVRVWDGGARYPLVIDPLIEPGAKLVGDCIGSCSGPNGTGEISVAGTGGGQFGISVALSGDGSTAVVGAWGDRNLQGAAWVFTRSGSVWSQQGAKLMGDCTQSCSGPNGTGESGQAGFGVSVALARDGNTALIGGYVDGNDEGAAWVFTRSGSVWRQQGAKLVSDCTQSCSGPNGTGESGAGDFGVSVALSGDGNAALIGARADGYGEEGAAWVFTRSGSVWIQQGAKLVGDCTQSCSGPNGTGEIDSGGLGGAGFGASVSLSGDGDTALIGAFGDNGDEGAAWVFTRSGSVWSQQGAKLVGDCTHSCSGPNGTGEISLVAVGGAGFGDSVALSGDGDTALIGAPGDRSAAGAAWVFTRSGSVWSQQGAKLVGDCTHSCSGANGIGESGTAAFGIGVALSGDGDTALIGAWYDRKYEGAAWVFTRARSVWSQQGAKLVGDCTHSCSGPKGTGETGRSGFGASVALPSEGDTVLIGALGDNDGAGAAWILTRRPPSNRFAVVRIHTYADGRITFAVTVSGPGTVDVLETAWNDNLATIARLLQPAAHRFTFARAEKTIRDAGTARFSVRPNARGRLLVFNHTYRVTLRLWVTYAPPGARQRSVGIYGLHLPPCTHANRVAACDDR
jgi:FG-GAP repeat